MKTGAWVLCVALACAALVAVAWVLRPPRYVSIRDGRAVLDRRTGKVTAAMDRVLEGMSDNDLLRLHSELSDPPDPRADH